MAGTCLPGSAFSKSKARIPHYPKEKNDPTENMSMHRACLGIKVNHLRKITPKGEDILDPTSESLLLYPSINHTKQKENYLMIKLHKKASFKPLSDWDRHSE